MQNLYLVKMAIGFAMDQQFGDFRLVLYVTLRIDRVIT